MTYATDLDSDTHRRAFYVAFDGIETRIATHDLTGLVSGTFVVGLDVDGLIGQQHRNIVVDAVGLAQPGVVQDAPEHQ